MISVSFDPVRFWSKVNKQGPVVHPKLGRCWTWTAATIDGYGAFGTRGREVELAHRVSWALTFGPPRACVLHKCDNSRCVRPSHLFAGTRADNNADKKTKGRQCRGESRPAAKLTTRAVRQLRDDWKTGRFSQCELAAKYGISQPIVSRTVRGERWRHV